MTDPGGVSARRIQAHWLFALSLMLCAGCAGTAVKSLSQARLEAISHNQRGVQQELRGDRDEALAEFSEALRLHGSIENLDGMTVARINMARTHRLRGDLRSARSVIDPALALLPEPSDLAPELFFENAKIYLAAGDLVAAKDWSLRSAALEKGGELGRRLNLVGTVLLRGGSAQEAREQVERALKVNRDRGMAVEEANSLRLLGEIHLGQGRNAEAIHCFNAALLLDKDLGLGKKIASDLRGLGAAASKNDDLAGAVAYYRRAVAVSLSGGDAGAAAEATARLAELYRKAGEPLPASKLEEQRAKPVQEGEKRQR